MIIYNGATVTTEGKETVFTLPSGEQFRVTAVSGSKAVEAFQAWLKARPTS